MLEKLALSDATLRRSERMSCSDWSSDRSAPISAWSFSISAVKVAEHRQGMMWGAGSGHFYMAMLFWQGGHSHVWASMPAWCL